MKIEGILPYKNAITASADSLYFLEHGTAFINSCRQQDNYPHIHLINPSSEARHLADKLKIDYTFEQTPGAVKTYYACNRFLVAPYLMTEHVKLLILDIDCYLNKHFEFFDDSIEMGIFLREPLGQLGWLNRGTKVAAGMLYLTEKARTYILIVGTMLHDLGMVKWFADQVALHEAWEMVYKGKDRNRYKVFDNEYLDWEFTPDSIVWTGKGPRKYNNRTYINKKKEIENSSI